MYAIFVNRKLYLIEYKLIIIKKECILIKHIPFSCNKFSYSFMNLLSRIPFSVFMSTMYIPASNDDTLMLADVP